jgi:hypothetical protein
MDISEEELKGVLIGLAVACPMEDEEEYCPMKDYRKYHLVNFLQSYELMRKEEKIEIYLRHKNCLKSKEDQLRKK